MEGAAKIRPLTWRELAIPFTVFLLFYTLTISRVPSAVTDSISYIVQIDSGKHLFHPHHLLFNQFARSWVLLWRLAGVHTDTAILVAQLNAIFGALGLCVFYSLLRRRFGCDSLTALLGTCLPAFSWAFWYYSGCVEVYIIPLFLLLLSFSLLTGEQVDARTFALVGFLNGVAVVFAEMSVLFATVVFLSAWFNYRRRGGSLARSLASYVLLAVPTAAIPYALVLLRVRKATAGNEAWSWLTLYAHYPRYWSSLAVSSVTKATIGLGQAFVGSHFLFALPRARFEIGKLLPDYYLADKAFLVRNLGTAVAYLLVVLVVAALLLVVLTLVGRLRYWRLLSPRQQEVVYLLAVWFVTYGSFTFFYTAVNAKFWIAPTVCFWLVFEMFLLKARVNPEKSRQWNKVILGGALVVTLWVNYMGSIRFTRDEANDYYRFRVKPLVELSRPGDLIIVGTEWKYESYLLDYGRPRVLSLTSFCETGDVTLDSVGRVQSIIDQDLAKGARVVVSGEALEPEVTTRRLCPQISMFHLLWDRYRERWNIRGSQTNAIYLLEGSESNQLGLGSDAKRDSSY
jgi:hypothetical protein